MKQRGQDGGGLAARLSSQSVELGMDLLGNFDRFHARGVSVRRDGFNRTAMNRCAVAMRNLIYAMALVRGRGLEHRSR
jgi:hypothetical protein